MKRWLAASLLGVALLAAVGFWGYRQHQVRQDLEVFLTNRYQMSFFDMATHVKNLETALAKSLVAKGTGEDVAIFSEIWLRADSAQSSLTQLPVSTALTERTAKFLSQVGDYSYTVSKEIVDTEELTDHHWNTLNRLYRQATELNKDISEMEEQVVEGRLTLSELQAKTRQGLDDADRGLDGELEKINRNMQTHPTLIYDGPFSDHLEKRKPQGLKGESISAEKAREIALDFIDKENKNYTARVVGKNKGRIESYTVELIPRDNNENLPRYMCDVSQQGGKVIWYLGNKEVENANFSVEQAREKARQFLKSRGKENMVDTFHSKQGNMVTVQFVATEGDVMLYPDQIKCLVSLDDGRVLAYEASQYWMASKDRDLKEAVITQEEAREKVNPHMNVESARLALIPKENYQEVLCWELTGSLNEDTFLVYINAETGKKESVKVVVDTPNGQLTM
ncbi:germination protein YpeB [Desulfofalx alkaliphila]|uniref:germination protein YpeB n=1 Tax=Desulfofalx alkaliphila TaxID=105483 RepID=UPI0004E287D9|nr:germination protein YpeB [Desulfofalx alkaliphila]